MTILLPQQPGIALLRAKHGDGLDLDEQLGAAKNGLDAGRRWQGAEPVLFAERGALLVEGFVITLDVAQVASIPAYLLAPDFLKFFILSACGSPEIAIPACCPGTMAGGGSATLCCWPFCVAMPLCACIPNGSVPTSTADIKNQIIGVGLFILFSSLG